MARNLLTNPDFEDGTGDSFTWWSRYAGGSASYDEETSDVFSGSRCFKMVTNGSDACYLYQNCGCEVGQEYTISFWAKRVSGDAAFYLWGPFLTGNVPLTNEWKKYSYTGICTATEYALGPHFNRNTSTGVLLIDKVRCEPTPVKYAVMTLPLADDIASPDTDFFIEGFGTPKAAMVMMCNAEVGNPTVDHAVTSIGFWDGTTQHCSFTGLQNALSTSNSRRGAWTSKIAVATLTTVQADYTIANVASSGVTITLATDATTRDRYATVIMWAGHDVEADVGYYDAADGSPVTGIGFRPDVLLTSTPGIAASTSALSTYGIWSAGAAMWRPSLKQRVLGIYDLYNASTMDTATLIDGDKMSMQVSSSVTWNSEFGGFTADGFKQTVSGSTGSDDTIWLALKLPGINVDIHDFQIPTSDGPDSVTGVGFKPGLLISFVGNETSLDTRATHLAACYGASDGTNEGAHGFRSVDNVNTSNTGSNYSAALVAKPSPSGDIITTATVSSFDSDGYTLNWSNVSVKTQNKYGFTIAFQDPDDTKISFGNASGRILFKT